MPILLSHVRLKTHKITGNLLHVCVNRTVGDNLETYRRDWHRGGGIVLCVSTILTGKLIVGHNINYILSRSSPEKLLAMMKYGHRLTVFPHFTFHLNPKKCHQNISRL